METTFLVVGNLNGRKEKEFLYAQILIAMHWTSQPFELGSFAIATVKDRKEREA